jgi:hypothetical protein
MILNGEPPVASLPRFLENATTLADDRIQPNPLLMSNLGRIYGLLSKELASVVISIISGVLAGMRRRMQRQLKHESVPTRHDRPALLPGFGQSPILMSAIPLAAGDAE